MKSENISLDYQVIYEMVEFGSRILDLGCGQGDLMNLLAQEKEAKVQGIELNEEAVYKCVEKGLSVFHGDLDSGLSEYPDKSFEYVILNQSLQQVKRVDFVIQEALRVADKVIVGFPNFAHYRSRWQLFFNGTSPITGALPYNWYETPNLRFLSVRDFLNYCHSHQVDVERQVYLTEKRRIKLFPNLLANTGIFLLKR